MIARTIAELQKVHGHHASAKIPPKVDPITEPPGATPPNTAKAIFFLLPGW
jgi:hypothetical protein